ncbi:DUF805 domain-containing protein [Acuticoccus sp. M5D2P5]|uniref:DUF805 domain-containing protein n=1 Tax=Acuticoccus kalidii TaxID=2910977 RepID=UPI001F25C4C7|nr:DUF805 domain-containing protein [Acuticoccus kalidii]MCF3935653.1 DUF805 domain-containing protein [Acuticoccus kalidii]
MFRDYLGDPADGRLGRGRFILLWLLLGIVTVGVLIVVMIAFGALGGVLARISAETGTPPPFIDAFPIPMILAIVAVVLGSIYAGLNITAKRARDVGLPGWLVAIVIAFVSGGTIPLSDNGATIGAGFLLSAILALLPSGWIGRG